MSVAFVSLFSQRAFIYYNLMAKYVKIQGEKKKDLSPLQDRPPKYLEILWSATDEL